MTPTARSSSTSRSVSEARKCLRSGRSPGPLTWFRPWACDLAAASALLRPRWAPANVMGAVRASLKPGYPGPGDPPAAASCSRYPLGLFIGAWISWTRTIDPADWRGYTSTLPRMGCRPVRAGIGAERKRRHDMAVSLRARAPRALITLVSVLVAVVVGAVPALANVALTKISSDP